MSGGFFRGTSADQDTRFSNKQAKLLKSQKFAAELENLVDMTKVKMDVMKPWIAKRVTELIGFEDEVLINFIYGLLEGKAVNGKQVQIQLTGFMERNTGKFMKELWVLLLSAQQNVSGVPQPFLDAKEEEFKTKAESDRIANENRMRKERDNKELDQEKTRMDNDGENAREKRAVRELDRKHEPDHTADPRKDGSRGRSRGSGSSESGSGSPPIRRKHSMSPSKSPSSRSHSKERQGSRSFTRVTRSRSRSVSSEMPRHSLRRRSVTPRPKCNTRRSHSPSPLGRRSFYSNRGSVSSARRRSPSPRRNRFRPPLRYRSRSPLRRRSRSPIKRRSRTPPRYRSRSPVRRRSPSPLRRRSPVRRRSPPPARRRSPPPARRRSPPPARRRSPSLSRSISRSPVRRPYRHTSSSPHNLSTSPVRGRPSMHDQKRSSPVPRRSPSPQYSSSQSPTRPSSLSPRRRASPRRVAKSPSQSPDHQDSIKERPELKNSNGSKAVARKPTVSQMATQRDMLEQNDLRRKERDSQKASIGAEGSRDSSRKGGRRASSPCGSPYQKREGASPPENLSTLPKAAELKPSREISETNKDDRERFSRREIGDHKYRSSGRASQTPVQPKDSLDSAVTSGLAKSRKTQSTDSDRLSDKVDNREFGLSGKGKDTHVDSERSNHLSEMESLPELSKMSEKNGLTESPLKKLDDPNTKVKEKRKHKRSDADSDDYSSNDSYGEKREAKKRRKEEKKLKKQERRKRREERRLRKQGGREEKLKSKAVDRGSSSSNSEADDSLDAEAEKKRIEIELREKALESLRAKRGIGN